MIYDGICACKELVDLEVFRKKNGSLVASSFIGNEKSGGFGLCQIISIYVHNIMIVSMLYIINMLQKINIMYII